MEFTTDELARLIAICEHQLSELKKYKRCVDVGIDYITPLFTLYSNLLKAYYEGDKILHIGIKD